MNIVAANPITIAMIMAMIPGSKYVSATDCGAGVVAGVCVGAASSTATAVSACDGQYDSDPWKLAITVYLPGISGVHCKLYNPFASLVVAPMFR